MLKTASVKCFLLEGFRFVHVNILAKKRESPYIQSWTKLLRKLHTWEAFFLNFVANRFFPAPPPPGSSVVGLQKKAGSLSPGGGGGGGVMPYMGYIGMCRCEGYGFQAVYSRIAYINQSVWV